MKNIIDVILPMDVMESARQNKFNTVKKLCKKYNLEDKIGSCPYDHTRFPLAIRIDLVKMNLCLHNNAEYCIQQYYTGAINSTLIRVSGSDEFIALDNILNNSLRLKLNTLLNEK